jgi:hypothetical protein
MTDNIIHIPLKMPQPLAKQVAVLNLPPNPEYAEHPPLEPVYDPAAGDWLKRKREMIKQASRQQCHEWLAGLVLGINGVTRAQTEGREMAIWSMCRALPDLVWCEETMQAMWARTSFLPTPGECFEVFEAHVAPLLAEIAALERIARVLPPRPVVQTQPYEPPPAPEWPWAWAGSRDANRGPDGLVKGSQRFWDVQEPVRSVAEQIAALKAATPPQAAD